MTGSSPFAGSVVDDTSVFDALPDAVVGLDLSLRVVAVNAPATRSLGPADDLLGRPLEELVHSEDLHRLVPGVATGDGHGEIVRFRTKHGFVRFEARSGRHGDRLVLSLRDAPGHESCASATLLQAVLEHTASPTVLVDRSGMVRMAGRAVERFVDPDAAVGRELSGFASPDERARVAAEMAAATWSTGPRTLQTSFVAGDGGAVPVTLTVTNLLDGPVDGLLVGIVEHAATHDPLTLLPRGDVLFDHITSALADSSGGFPVTVMTCTIEGLRAIGDRHGHAAHDAAVLEVADRLRHVVRSSDTVGRVDEDTFVLVLSGRDDRTAAAVSARVSSALAEPVVIGDGAAVSITATIGMASAERAGGVTAPSAAEVLAVQAHRLLNRVTMVGGALETLLDSEDLLAPEKRRKLLSAGADAARTLSDELRALARGHQL